MKKSEIHSKAKERLRALNIIGIDSNLLQKAKVEIESIEAGVSSNSILPESISLKSIPQKDTPEKLNVRIIGNFCKIDCDILDRVLPTMDVYEQAIYVRLFRLSYGYDRNWCTVGYNTLAEACNIKKTGVVNAIKRLLDKGWIKAISFNHAQGTTYRVYLPIETGMDSKTTIKVNSVSSTSIPLESIPLENTDSVSLGSIPSRNTQSDNSLQTKENIGGVFSGSIPSKNTTIDRSLNIDLSLDEVIYLYYNSIGQEKISQKKRERAKKCFEELIQDGFSQEDIVFAIDWTIKNAKEKPYDFALIKDTIGQAIAAKKETELEEQKTTERDQKRIKQLEEEKKLYEERELIANYKESLSPKQRSELREKALDEIRKSGNIRQELIGQPLIEIKENEILRKEMSINK